MTPKTARILADSDYPYILPWFVELLQAGVWIFYLCFGLHILGSLLTLAIVVIPIAKLPLKLRTSARRFLLVAAPILFLFASAAIFSELYLTQRAYHAQDTELRSYRRILAEFALEEAAAGRLKAVNERMRILLGHEMVSVDSVDDLSRMERKEQVSRLANLLKKEPESDLLDVRMLRKIVLATLVLFRDDVRSNSPTADLVILETSNLSDRSFENLDEAFDWIASQSEEDGWNAMPLRQARQRKDLR